MKLLIVEDEAPAVASLRRGLSEEGYAVDVASEAARARQSGGLGLDLAIARAIAGARCAHTSVKSRSGQGAAFTAFLPASAPVLE